MTAEDRPPDREIRDKTNDEWGDLSKLHEVSTAETMRRLAEEERAPDLEGRIQEAVGMIEGRLADTRPRISPLFLEALLRVLRGEEPGDVPTAPSPRARTPSDHGWG